MKFLNFSQISKGVNKIIFYSKYHYLFLYFKLHQLGGLRLPSPVEAFEFLFFKQILVVKLYFETYIQFIYKKKV